MGKTKSYEDMTKEEIVKRETAKFQKLKKNIEPEQWKALETLVDEAAFMGASLFELRAIINEKGYTEEYQNGANQKGTKKCSEVEIYNVMIKNYSAIIKQITEISDKNRKKTGENEVEGDGFLDFLKMKNVEKA